jgi:hypothetical protein
MTFYPNPLAMAQCLLAVVAAQLVAVPAQAASFTWPDSTAPCNGTLQACIDAAPSPSIVFIAADNVVNTGPAGQNVRLTQSVSLAAATGFDPVFPSGIGIIATPTTAIEVSISGITLRDADLTLLPSAGGSFYVERMRLLDNSGAGGIDFEALGTAPVYLRIHDNEYIRRGGAGNFLSASSSAAPISGEVSFNRVSIPDTGSSAYGIVIASHGGGGFDFTVANNELRSGFAFGGICALSNVLSGTAANNSIRIYGNVLVPLRRGAGSAVCVFGGEGAIEARVSHNTIVGFGSAISMITRPFTPPASTQPITGYVLGNLLAHNNTAFRRDSIAAAPGDAVSNGQNLFFDNNADFAGTAAATAGSGTVTSDPLLYSLQYPYLMPGSPAIGRGNFLAVPANYPLLDADGTRRFKNVSGGGSNVIDIGAYEFGDDWFNTRANGSNNSANTVRLAHPSLNGTQSARALVTPNFALGSVSNSVPFGVFYDTTSLLWAVYNQNTATSMPNGAGYSALTPAPGTGLFLHQVAPTGPTLGEAILDNSATNDLPDQIVLATSNWNPATPVGVYNNHNISVGYGADDRWRIRNSDGVAYLNSAAFNVYAQPPSISAFRHQASAGNSTANTTVIDNPRLNGFRCAELMVTPMSSFGDRQFDIYYANGTGRWQIFALAGMPAGATFNVAFSPRQVTECGRPMFADGFEN